MFGIADPSGPWGSPRGNGCCVAIVSCAACGTHRSRDRAHEVFARGTPALGADPGGVSRGANRRQPRRQETDAKRARVALGLFRALHGGTFLKNTTSALRVSAAHPMKTGYDARQQPVAIGPTAEPRGLMTCSSSRAPMPVSDPA